MVKATDLKSVGLCPRWFKSCWCRYFIFFLVHFFTCCSLLLLPSAAPENMARGLTRAPKTAPRLQIHMCRGLPLGSPLMSARRKAESRGHRPARHKSHSLCTHTATPAGPGISGSRRHSAERRDAEQMAALRTGGGRVATTERPVTFSVGDYDF